MLIITSKSKSRRFKPHYNNAMGKYYGSSKDYVKDLNDKGMEPYREGQGSQGMASNKKYKPSEWSKKMTKIGVDQVKQNGKTSGAFNSELAKHLKTKAPERITSQTKGGSYSE